jgi:hypothetical protein
MPPPNLVNSIISDPDASDLGIGAVVWDSSVIFAKYIENNPNLFKPEDLSKQRILELGSSLIQPIVIHLHPMPYDIIICTDCVFGISIIHDLLDSILIHCSHKSLVYCCYERDEVCHHITLHVKSTLLHF